MIAVAVAVVASIAAACVEDRARPGPPVLQIMFDRTGVKSPDSLTGTVVVRDPDGLDSIWLTIESSRSGQDGLLNDAFSSRFSYSVPPGIPAGSTIPVRLEARDLSGFLSTLDTNAVIIN